MASPDSSLKPDLRYSQGYLITWVQLEMGIFDPPTLPWLTQTARSSQTSGTVKDISYLGYSPGYTAWNGNFLFNNATTANQGSPLKPDYSSLGYTAWNGNFFIHTTLPWLTLAVRPSLTSGTVKDIWYLGYSSGYTTWNGNFFYLTSLPWLTKAVCSSQTSGTVKDVRYLWYSLGYTAWNGNFVIQQRYHG